MIEEMLKKVTTERAPVAGQQNGRGGAGGRLGASSDLLGALQGQSGGSNAMVESLLGSSRSPFDLISDHVNQGSGVAAAAGVLTAVDEDNEGDAEAEVPDEFEYFSDATDSDE